MYMDVLALRSGNITIIIKGLFMWLFLFFFFLIFLFFLFQLFVEKEPQWLASVIPESEVLQSAQLVLNSELNITLLVFSWLVHSSIWTWIPQYLRGTRWYRSVFLFSFKIKKLKSPLQICWVLGILFLKIL